MTSGTATSDEAITRPPDDHYGGDSPRNIVNRLTAGGMGGIQIEQSLQARDATTGVPSPTSTMP